jgi:hypothetical protein
MLPQQNLSDSLIKTRNEKFTFSIKRAWDDYLKFVLGLLPDRAAKLIVKHHRKLYIVVSVTVLQLIIYSALFLWALRAYKRSHAVQ